MLTPETRQRMQIEAAWNLVWFPSTTPVHASVHAKHPSTKESRTFKAFEIMVPQMGKPRLQEVLLGLALRVGAGYGTF